MSSVLDHISPSALKTAGKCLMMWKYAHIDKTKRAPGIAMVFGSALHKTLLETDQARRIATGAYAPLEELKETFSSDFQKRLIEVDALDPELIEDYGTLENAYTTSQRVGLKVIDKYNEGRDALKCRGVEVPFRVEFGGTYMEGRFDADVSDTEYTDLKTKIALKRFRSVSVDAVQNDRQFAAYAAAKAKMTGKQGQWATGVYLHAKESPVIQTVEGTYGEKNHKALEELTHRLVRMAEADAFVPVDKGSQNGWCCSAKYCGYWQDTCPFGRRAQVTV